MKGKKTCPHCQHATGPRSHLCPNCHKPFVKKEPVVKSVDAPGRGRKRCDGCGAYTGPRTKICPKCNKAFTFTPSFLKEKRESVYDWRTLVPGDHIRVIAGGGPYQMIANGQDVEEKHCLGYCGIFKVWRLEQDGILASSAKRNRGGTCYIYMGEEVPSKYGWMRAPHKIVKVKRKVR